jgi:succinoglycan biosynthesis protein ExoA
MSDLPFVSVILPVRNERMALPALLGSLERQDYPRDRFEILVCDGFSEDGTRELVAERARRSSVSLRLLDNPKRRSGPARNVGVQHARGEFLLFIDGHCSLPNDRLIRSMVEIFDQTGADCLCRPQPLTAALRTPIAQAISLARASWLGHGRDSLIYNLEYRGSADPASSGAMYRKEVFESIGNYDESFDACEDVEFNVRVRKFGFQSYSDPSLAVCYEPRASFGGLWTQMIRYGRGRVRLMRKHNDCVSASQVLPALLLLYFALLPLVCWLPVAAALVFCLPALGVAAAFGIASLQIAARHGPRYLLLAPITFGCIYFGLGAGLLWEALADLAPAAFSRSEAEPLRPDENPG